MACTVCSKIGADEAVNESLDNYRRFYFRHIHKQQDDSEKQAFQYERLPENRRHARLLELHPGEQDDPIVATLKCTSLDEPLQYAALSYTWGTLAKKRTVCVNGKDILVSMGSLILITS